jgi:hypothetical protein
VFHPLWGTTEWLHIEDVFPQSGSPFGEPQSGCTSSMCFREAEAPLGNHKVVAHLMHIFDMQVFPRSPFHFVEAHFQCVSAKRLHIEDVLPLWGCTSYAHQRCVPSPLGLHITDVLAKRKGLHIRDVFLSTEWKPLWGCTSQMC